MFCYQKITLCKKTKTSKSAMMTSYVWHCFALTARKIQLFIIYFSALSCHTAPVGHNSVGSKTESIRPRLKPRPKLQDQERGRPETAVSDPRLQLGLLVTYKISNRTAGFVSTSFRRPTLGDGSIALYLQRTTTQ